MIRSLTAINSQKAEEVYAKASALLEKEKIDEGMSVLVEAGMLFEKNADSASIEKSVVIYNWLGMLFLQNKNLPEQALQNFQKALRINKSISNIENEINIHRNIGHVYGKLLQYDKALWYMDQAAAAYKAVAESAEYAELLNGIARYCFSWGMYDKCINYYKSALSIYEDLKNPDGQAVILDGIGRVYGAWGLINASTEYHKKALEIFTALELEQSIAVEYIVLGTICYTKGEYESARKYYYDALVINKKLGLDDLVAASHLYFGNIFMAELDFKKGLAEYYKALELHKKTGNTYYISSDLYIIAWAYKRMMNLEKSIMYFEKAMQMDEWKEDKASSANTMRQLGEIEYYKKKYDKAAGYLEKSISLYEEIRRTAGPTAKREYLALQIETYQFLIEIYLCAGQLDEALWIREFSSSKLLLEQLGRSGQEDWNNAALRKYRQSLDAEQAVLCYLNIAFDKSALLVLTRDGIQKILLNKKQIVELYQSQCGIIDALLEESHILRISGHHYDSNLKTRKIEESFDNVINAYRVLLSRKSLSVLESDLLGNLSRALYTFLLAPLRGIIKNKSDILIVPEGILSIIPYESLTSASGKFFIEEAHVHYTQSLGVLRTLENRSMSKAGSGKISAFGGAVYKENSYSRDMHIAEKELHAYSGDALLAMSRGNNLQAAYDRYGIGSWVNLPGTLKEAEAIKKIFPDARMITGKTVSEKTVKSLSRAGQLRGHRVIHFATHGIVVPETPELSALVLTADEGNENDLSAANDGYLTMNEISILDIEADFINLSACETGLGKIYGGEGIVGLTQSFLIAGANGISVSLWQVADDSTMKFMTGLYELGKENHSWPRAMTEMKRRFIAGGRKPGGDDLTSAASRNSADGGAVSRGGIRIKTKGTEQNAGGKPAGDEYASPFYWAAFVYYGK